MATSKKSQTTTGHYEQTPQGTYKLVSTTTTTPSQTITTNYAGGGSTPTSRTVTEEVTASNLLNEWQNVGTANIKDTDIYKAASANADIQNTTYQSNKPVFSEASLYADTHSFETKPVVQLKDDEGRIKGFESSVTEKSYFAGKDKYYEQESVNQFEKEASGSVAYSNALQEIPRTEKGSMLIPTDVLNSKSNQSNSGKLVISGLGEGKIPSEYLTANSKPNDTGRLTISGLGDGKLPPIFGGRLTENKKEKLNFSSPFSTIKTGYDPFMLNVQKSLQTKEIAAGRSGNRGGATLFGTTSALVSPISTKEKVKGLGASAAIGLGIGAVTAVLPPAGLGVLAVGSGIYTVSQVPKLQGSLLSSKERGSVAYRENIAYTGASIAAGVGGGYVGSKVGLKLKSLFPEKPQKPFKFDVTSELSERRIIDDKVIQTKAKIEVIARRGKEQYQIIGKGKATSFITNEKSSIDFGRVNYEIKPFKSTTESRVTLTPESYGDIPTFKVTVNPSPKTTTKFGTGTSVQQDFFGKTQFSGDTFVSSSLLNNKPNNLGFDIVAGYKILEGPNLPTKFKTIGYTEGITNIAKGTVKTTPLNVRSGFSSIIAEYKGNVAVQRGNGIASVGTQTIQAVSYSDIHTSPKFVIPEIKQVIQGRASTKSNIDLSSGSGGIKLNTKAVKLFPDSQSAVLQRTVQTSASNKLSSITKPISISKVVPVVLSVTKQTPITKTRTKTGTYTKTKASIFTVQKPTASTGIKSDILSIQTPTPINKIELINTQISKVVPIQTQIPIQRSVPIQKQTTSQRFNFNPTPPVPIGFVPPTPKLGMFSFGSGSGFSRSSKSFTSSKFTPNYTPSLEANLFGIKRTRMPKTFTGLELRGL